ncbi:MAG: hypothetical protein QM831_16960 [Kofleriaceae bacterium]
MRGTLALVLGLAAFTAACGGDDDDGGNGSGSSTPPTVSGVFPLSGFTGRTVRIEISGDATTFADGATIDLGAGITVKNVTVGSPTSLFADAVIDPTADLGKRDVKVTNGADSLTLTKAFEVDAAISIATSAPVQGGLMAFEIVNNDILNPFDDTCGFEIFGTCLQYSNTGVDVTHGLAQVSSVTANKISGTVFIDTDATDMDVTLTSGSLTSAPEDSVSVTARAPTALANGTISLSADGSQLFSAALTANVLTDMKVDTGGDDSSSSTIYLLPASGHWADGVQTGFVGGDGFVRNDAFSATATNVFFVYVDDGTEEGTDITVRQVTPGAAVTETEANNTTATAQNVTLPALITGGSITSDTDQDWFKFTVAAANNGKTLRVFTFGDPQADVLVDAFNTNANTSIGESGDSGFQENFASTDPLITGTSYVEISASSFGIDPNHNTYSAIIWTE